MSVQLTVMPVLGCACEGGNSFAGDDFKNQKQPLLDSICFFTNVRSERVDFGSGPGRSEVETTGVAAPRRGSRHSENAGRGRKMPFLADIT
jgi:hypothetical protein